MSVLYSPTLKYSDGELRRNQEMDSNKGHTQQSCHQQNSGLLRYRSAPSSLLASLVDNNSSHGCVNEEAFGGDDQQQQQQQQRYQPSLGSEMETMLAKLISSNNGWSNSESLHQFGGKPVKQEAGDSVPQGPQQNGYSSQLIYQSQEIQGLPNGCLSSGNGFDGSSSVISSMASENSKMGPGNCSNLIRQRSSPAGFLSNLSVKNGFAAFGEVGSFRGCDVSNGQATTSTGGLNGNITLTRKSSFSRRMPQIAENGNESLETTCVESRNLGNDNGSTTKCHMPSFTSDFWDSSTFGAQKTTSENDEIMFSISDALETQNADFGHQNLGLSHQWSFPSSTKMSAIEKFLQVQGSVPCKIRAKRGFATHPRSIAERVRRTRISERIKKLQELFPKSDKQTSTADMLDLAVDYIKDLQEQVQILTDTRAKCTCSSIQKQY